MEIAGKEPADITAEEIEFLKESYTSMGGLLPKGFNGGAFFTPTHVAEFIWRVLAPLLPEKPKVLEPSVGSGIFLEHAPADSDITALELDEVSAKVTSLIYPQAKVIQGDAILHTAENAYDVVIGNPPYGETINIPYEDNPQFSEWVTLKRAKTKKDEQAYWRGKSEGVFIEHAIKSAKPGGHIAFVLPKGIAFNSQLKKVRELLHDNCWQIGTVLLPCETFQHVGTTIETQILIVRKVTSNARKIKSAQTKWRGLRNGTQLDDFSGEFFEGQMPAYFAKVTDIGFDKDGNKTDKWGDGLTQLDELADDFNDDLVRPNLYPHVPSWTGKGDNEAFFFENMNGESEGAQDAKRTYAEGPQRWNELTLGAGVEVMWKGEEYSTMDYGWQDEIVAKYYAEKGSDDISEV